MLCHVSVQYLVDDYECVAEDGGVLPLPRHPNVNELFELYVSQVNWHLSLSLPQLLR